jgi:hypothetical protein
MSRFLSSYKRLKRKVALLELNHMQGDLGKCLSAYHATGILPEQAWLRDRVRWHVAMAAAMWATVPPCASAIQEAAPIPQEEIGGRAWGKPGTIVQGHKARGVELEPESS